jgi:hypothetical protein
MGLQKRVRSGLETLKSRRVEQTPYPWLVFPWCVILALVSCGVILAATANRKYIVVAIYKRI